MEILLVMAIIAIVAGIAAPISAGMLSRAKADSMSTEVFTWLDAARNRANAERRNFEVTFNTTTRKVRIDRVEPDLTKTLILERELPTGAAFTKYSGAPDTPDLFGNATAIDLDGPDPHMFTSDGSFIDANGDPSNGTIFFGRASQRETGRALTIFGTTGLIRVWKLSGNQWYLQ